MDEELLAALIMLAVMLGCSASYCAFYTCYARRNFTDADELFLDQPMFQTVDSREYVKNSTR